MWSFYPASANGSKSKNVNKCKNINKERGWRSGVQWSGGCARIRTQHVVHLIFNFWHIYDNLGHLRATFVWLLSPKTNSLTEENEKGARWKNRRRMRGSHWEKIITFHTKRYQKYISIWTHIFSQCLMVQKDEQRPWQGKPWQTFSQPAGRTSFNCEQVF